MLDATLRWGRKTERLTMSGIYGTAAQRYGWEGICNHQIMGEPETTRVDEVGQVEWEGKGKERREGTQTKTAASCNKKVVGLS